jgi:uncharacterized membrane protein YgdD (TMEM256/DUF423 family)
MKVPPAAERRRPAVVTVASGLLAAGGAMFAGEVLLSVNKYFTDMKVYEQAASDGIVSNDSGFAAIGVGVHLVMATVGIFTGIALVVLAVFTFAGQNWARAVGWIFGIPVLLWYGGLAALTFLANLLSAGDVDPTPAELARRYDQAWPPWLDTLDVVLMVLVSAALVTALVGQTVPTADTYFRRTRAASRAGRTVAADFP